MHELNFSGSITACVKVHPKLTISLLSSLVVCTALQAQTATELLARADKLADQGDKYRAGPLYAHAEKAFRAAGNEREELYAKFGRLLSESDHGNYKSIRAQVEHDLARAPVQRDPELKIKALALKGVIDLNIDTPEAESDWRQVLDAAIAAGDIKWQNRARGELGIVAGLNGKIGEAGAALFKAIATAQKIGDVQAAINFTIWLANGMALNGMADGALKHLEKASQLAQQGGYQKTPFLLSIAELRAITNLSKSEREQRMPEARTLFKDMLQLAEDEKVAGAEIELLNQDGQLELASGNTAQAEQVFLRAASVARSSELSGLAAESLLQLTRVYLRLGQFAKASVTIDEGFKTLRGIREGYDLPLFVAAQADVAAALGRLTAADALYDRATTLLEGLLVNASSSLVKSSMVSAFSEIYVSHFRLAWNQLHDSAKAFRIIESARGRILLDSLRDAQRSQPGTGSSPVELKIAGLQRTLLDSRLGNGQSTRILAQLDEAYDDLGIAQFDQERKEARILRRPPLTIAALQHLLEQDQVFVEFVLDRRVSYALEISQAAVDIHELPSSDQIERLTKSYLNGVTSGQDAHASSQALYSILLAPTLRQRWKSLIIVPDQSLHLLPFEALQDKSATYVVEHLTVSMAPSATVLAMLKQEEQAKASKEFLGIAFSDQAAETASAGSNTRGIADIRGASLKPLPFSREEVKEAKLALGGDSVILQGADASEAMLKSQPLSQFRVIHLAAHGLGDETEPDRAAILLKPGNSSEDGLWQAREIRHTRLNAEAVVLSSCETGTGRLEGQEGVMNLARAFLAAGAKSVVASYWKVQDRSTATLMEDFYEHLARGESVSDALRSSQLDFIKTYGPKAQPDLWAGFEVIGDGARTIVTATNGTK
jgi:CHAT domain-containing protein